MDTRPPRRRRAEPELREGLALGFHAVRGALLNSPRRVEKVLLARGQRDERTRQIVALARKAGVPHGQVPREAIERLAGGVRHQGIAARLAETELLTAAELVETLPERPLLVAIDSVSDPRNLGAIIRTAAAVGAHGLFLPGHRAAGLSPAVRRTAEGGIDLLPVARAGNLSRLLEALADDDIVPVALETRGGVPYWEAPLAGGVVLVAGAEEKGIRPSVLKRCPVRVTIPIREKVGSLNVSVAAGILLVEADRQRRRHGA
ncbi:MAG: 23S rRNA (guanosine(2251)-2'-O)-methyltransferase RlmB [Acidobacteriota bacterium]|nr:23S rRNA (guanosine(2251)-2'-O)-methyltransferase RlmB [Acidobacteriota bacterium]